MNPIRFAQRATCMVLAAFVTLGVVGGLNLLAAPIDMPAQFVVAAPCAKA
jgi:hypothetical protein